MHRASNPSDSLRVPPRCKVIRPGDPVAPGVRAAIQEITDGLEGSPAVNVFVLQTRQSHPKPARTGVKRFIPEKLFDDLYDGYAVASLMTFVAMEQWEGNPHMAHIAAASAAVLFTGKFVKERVQLREHSAEKEEEELEGHIPNM